MTIVKVVAGADACVRPEQHDILTSSVWNFVVGMLLMEGGVLLVAFKSHRRNRRFEQYYDGDLHGLTIGQCIQVPEGVDTIVALIRAANRRRITTFGCSIYVPSSPVPRLVQICEKEGISCIYCSDSQQEVNIHQEQSPACAGIP